VEFEISWHTLLESVPDAVVIVDSAGRIVRANSHAENMFGYARQELLGHPVEMLIPAQFRERHSKHFEGYQAHPQTRPMGTNLTLIALRKSGTEFPVEISLSPMPAPEGVLTIAVIHDITRRKMAEGEIRKMSERFYRLAENAQDIIYRYRLWPARGFEYVNAAATGVTGYTPEEHYADPDLGLKIVHPDDRPLVDKLMRAESAFVEPLTMRWITKNGKIIWTEQRNVPVYDDERQLIAIEGIARDVTERKKAELVLQDLAQSVSGATGEQLLSSLVQHLTQTLNMDYAFVGEVIRENPQKIRTVAVCARGMIVKNFEYAQVNTPCAGVVGKKLCVYKEGVRRLFPHDTLAAEMGVECYIGIPLFDSSGEPLGLLVAMDTKPMQDTITAESMLKIFAVRAVSELQRSRSEEEMARISYERDAILSSTKEAMFAIDNQRRILYCNQAATKMFGYSQEELTGKTTEILYPSKEMYLDFGKILPEIREKGYLTKEFQLRRADGELFTAECTVSHLRINEQEIGRVSVVRDVSERKRLEEELRQSQKIEAIGRLAGGVAHDFNNILMAISGYSELLLMKLESFGSARQDVEQILRSVDQAASLTRQLLAFSRKQILELQVLDMGRVVAGLDLMLHRLIPENIEVFIKSAPETGRIKADRGQIEQVILNLAVNARDAMPNGGKLHIEVSSLDLHVPDPQVHQGTPPGRYVLLTVSDTGHGMDDATKSHIFEPFFTTKELGKGTGLGLATVYGIVKQSDGYIWVSSEPGKGSTFAIYLPGIDEPPGPVTISASTRQLSGTETILLVDDNDSLRTTFTALLEVHGYKVLPAANGIEALDVFRNHAGQIHLLITDVVMPKMSGYELAESLRQQTTGIKVLYMTGYTENAIQYQGVLAENVALIQKPFSKEILLQKIREVLDNYCDPC